MMTPFLEGMVAGYGIAIPVGAVAILIVNTAIQFGFGTGFVAGAGAASADLLYATLASAAGAAIGPALQPFSTPLRLAGGLVLIGFAAHGLWSGLRPSSRAAGSGPSSSTFRTYLAFLGITLVNPLTVIYFTAVILGGRSPSGLGSLEAGLFFIAGVGLASLSWQTLLAAIGGFAGTHLSPRFRVVTGVLGNLIVLALGARLLAAAIL